MWKKYRRTNVVEMRPYVLGEPLNRVSISEGDNPIEDMGMIARNPKNPNDQWYIAKKYFLHDFEEI